VRAEIDWFGKMGVDYLDNADANFGILKRDVEIARQLAETKTKYGFPKTFRTSFAKNSNDTIWEIANIFHDAKMLKSVTLAMQSMDENVLVNIKRKNIKFSKFGELVARYEAAGIPTYTELILGLAGETLDMFLDGIDKNLDAGQHSGLFTYLNLVLNNTEQATPEYRRAHGIESLPLYAMLSHGTPDDTVPRERQEVVIATAAMPHAEWKEGFLHGRVIEAFHSMGLLQDVAITARTRGIRYRDFYSQLIQWMRANPHTIAGREFANIEAILDRALAGGLWDCVDARLSDISWPPEEFMFARICLELDQFYDEVEEFLRTMRLLPGEIILQRAALARPMGDTVAWAREVVWYGRRGYAKR
jgi:putative methyltransferase